MHLKKGEEESEECLWYFIFITCMWIVKIVILIAGPCDDAKYSGTQCTLLKYSFWLQAPVVTGSTQVPSVLC